MAALNVDVWPEHDDPRVLIVYRGTLGASVPLPYALTLLVPAAAQIHAVAYRRGGELLSTQFQSRAEGGRLRVAFVVPEREFQFEYYVDAIEGLPQRSFMVELVFPLLVESLRVAVEQPLRASAFILTPPPQSTASSGGFTYHLSSVQRWPAGKAWTLRARYRKTDANPSLPRAGPPPAVTPPASPATVREPLLWVLPGIAGVLLGVAGTVATAYLRGQRRSARRSTAPSASRRPKRRRGNEGADQLRYCQHCGARARPGDRYCARCGRPLVTA